MTMSKQARVSDETRYAAVPYALYIANSCAEDQTHKWVWAKVAKILAEEVRRLTTGGAL